MFFVLALLVTALIMSIGAAIGTFFIRLFNTLDHVRLKRRLSVYGYQCFYLDYRSMGNDANCIRLLPTLRDVYTKGSSFSPFCPRLSEERLPMNVLMNWSRSIAEDLFAAQIPSVKLDQWNHYWNSKIYTKMTLFHSDFPEYEEHELGCLWGVVYLWLVVRFEKDINDELMNRIVHLACKEKPAAPYFYHFYNAARKSYGGYYLSYAPNDNDIFHNEENFSEKQIKDFISPEDVYNGFESLSISERCKARQVLNDVLADCLAWKTMRNEMKSRGWFKETIYPIGETKINIGGDYYEGDKVEHKTVIPHVDNYKPKIKNQNMNIPMSLIEELGEKLLIDE